MRWHRSLRTFILSPGAGRSLFSLSVLLGLLTACSDSDNSVEAATSTIAPQPTSAAASPTRSISRPTSVPTAAVTPVRPDTPAPSAPTTLPTSTPPTRAEDATVVGRNIAFNITSLVANAGQPLIITFDNQDPLIPHNLHIFAGTEGDFATEIRDGPDIQTLTVTINQPGSYNFQCDVHPVEMSGILTAQ